MLQTVLLFPQEYYSSEYLARNSVKNKFALGFMRVPENYTNTIIKIMTKQIVVKESDALPISGINIEIDMTSKTNFIGNKKYYLFIYFIKSQRYLMDFLSVCVSRIFQTTVIQFS